MPLTRPMTPYQRLCATLTHEKPDRVPLEIMAADSVIENLRAHTGSKTKEELLLRLGVDFRRVDIAINKKHPVPPQAVSRYGSKGSLGTSPYGVVLLRHPNFPQGHRVYGPLYDSENLDSFDWPGLADVLAPESIATETERLNRAGFCTVTGCDNPFKLAYFMRPYEEFLIDCLVRPDYAVELLKRIAAVEFTRAENGVRAGARCAMIFGDFAHQQALMVSPEVFRRVLRPLLEEFVSRLKAINPEVFVFLHSDGDLSAVLQDLIDCGFAAVHPIQPECMDMAAVKKQYGHALTLFGGVSVQSELPGSKPEAIRRIVRERIEQLGGDGGFILAPTNTLIEDVPLDSILAMYDEAMGLPTTP
jgi:uroporphyrinogen decarboxylase